MLFALEFIVTRYRSSIWCAPVVAAALACGGSLHGQPAGVPAQPVGQPANAAPQLVNPNDPADLYLQSFIKSKEADRAEKQGDLLKAVALHETSLRIIQQIQKINPQWRSGLVNYRLKNTEDRIRALRSGGAQNLPDSAPQQAAATQQPAGTQQPYPQQQPPTGQQQGGGYGGAMPRQQPMPPQQPYQPPQPGQQQQAAPVFAQSLDQLQNSIADNQRQMQQSQAEQSLLANQTVGAKQQLDMLDQTRAQLSETQRQLQAAISERDTLRQRLNNSMQGSPVLANEVEELRGRLARAETQLAAIQDSESEAIDTMRAQLEATQDRLKRVMIQNEELERQAAMLSAQLNDSQARLSQMPTSVAGMSPAQFDMLRSENDILRDVINRQLADQPNRERMRQVAIEEMRRLQVQSDVLERQIEVLAAPQVKLTPEQVDLLKNSRASISSEYGGTSAMSAPEVTSAYRTQPPPVVPSSPIGGEAPTFGIPPDMQSVAADAVSAFGSGDYDRAAGKFREIADRHPNNVYALSNLGVVLVEMKRYDLALEYLAHATRLAPEDGFSWSALGIAQYMTGRVTESIESLNRAVALNPRDPQSRNYLGLACAKDGRLTVAETELQKAIELMPDYAEAYYNLAVVYSSQRPPNMAKAKQFYDKAISRGMIRNAEFESKLPKS